MKSTIFFVILTVFMLILVGNLLRSRKIRERYAVLWVAVGLFMLILVAFPDLLAWFAGLVGVAVPSNLLFALAIIRLLGITLQLTLEVSRAEDRSRVLAEHVAILNLEMRVAGLNRLPDGATDGDEASDSTLQDSEHNGSATLPDLTTREAETDDDR